MRGLLRPVAASVSVHFICVYVNRRLRSPSNAFSDASFRCRGFGSGQLVTCKGHNRHGGAFQAQHIRVAGGLQFVNTACLAAPQLVAAAGKPAGLRLRGMNACRSLGCSFSSIKGYRLPLALLSTRPLRPMKAWPAALSQRKITKSNLSRCFCEKMKRISNDCVRTARIYVLRLHLEPAVVRGLCAAVPYRLHECIAATLPSPLPLLRHPWLRGHIVAQSTGCSSLAADRSSSVAVLSELRGGRWLRLAHALQVAHISAFAFNLRHLIMMQWTTSRGKSSLFAQCATPRCRQRLSRRYSRPCQLLTCIIYTTYEGCSDENQKVGSACPEQHNLLLNGVCCSQTNHPRLGTYHTY